MLVIIHLMRDLEEAEEEAAENEIPVPRPRFFRRVNAFENFSDSKFLKNFRLSKATTRELIAILTPFMHEGARVTDLSIEVKVSQIS